MNISKIILGTVQFGMPYGINNNTGKPSAAEVKEILDLAWQHGIRELDCADMYGDAQAVIGQYHQRYAHRFSINTKFKFAEGLTISAQLEAALACLHITQANVYFFHRYSDMIDHPEAIDELNELKSQRKISKTGVSIYTNDDFAACIENDGVDVIQLPFNLLDNFSKRGRLMQDAKQRGKTLHVRSVFLQGLFFKEPSAWPGYLAPLSKYVGELHQFATEHKVTMYDLALNYALSRPEIDNVIIGVDSKRQLEMNLDIRVPDAAEGLWEKVDSLHVEEESLLSPTNWK